jgi:hypothetical protein
MHLATLLVAALVLLTGCGGEDDSTPAERSPTSTPSAPATTTTGQAGERGRGDGFSDPIVSVKIALVSEDPALACGELVTAEYLRTAYGDEQACVAAVRSGSQARSVRIVSVKRSDGRATVKAIPAGGPSAGETLTITAVIEHSDALEGDVWKVDAVRSNVPVGP